ncbi:restriction endonuclease subunit S [Gillisia limnaea]|uniref:Restriction modification system DNA specificity domain-containing protein n=1 Tax=Gillisia limnaea (strain DSM 15749 / LMG 21470 / R-8282) TaxID=865937 RepID=H2BXT5_GILLR|nr:restriction endonuclease subunit S [Gillisia limnaea]EHQ02098.1 restriction modification system DNA specificity domain-containing protein [Gillisia limnaea DSM 15749]
MRSKYKRLCDYIEIVNKRNKKLEVETLLGVSIKKMLMPSIANTIGTDMSTYKIIKRNQFAYGPVTSRNGDKISIAILDEYDKAIVSQAYTVFKIIDETELNPEYLMMWFRRSEFDRYARFKSHGSARETFDWSELCETGLPIPSIEKQQEIVKEYNVVKNRITLNEQLNQNLEKTAQALYKHWFVDFEFPITKENHSKLVSGSKLIGYKSAGGKMVYNEEMDKEIPEGWGICPFTEIVGIGGGGTPKTSVIEYWNGDIPFYTPGDLSNNYYVLSTVKHISNAGLKKCSSKLYPVNTLFITARGATVGGIAIAGFPMAMNQTCYAMTGTNINNYFVHQLCLNLIEKLKSEAIGATFQALVTKDFNHTNVISPNRNVIDLYGHKVKPLYKFIWKIANQTQRLKQFQNLLLSKMATIEDKMIPVYE